MNEQLQKIAEDAGVDARTMGFESNQHHRDPWNARLEKFAELIVQECIDMIKPTSDHEAFAQNYLGGVDGLELLDGKIKNIKEHFGVSE
jgi:hypothetical protein